MNVACRLYFFYAPNCPHCAMAEPDVTRFHRKHKRVLVVRVNNNNRDAGIDGFAPAGTPAYLLKVNERKAFHHIGRLTLVELDKAYDEALSEHATKEELGLAGDDEDDSDDIDAESKEQDARDEEE
ncbi:MAG: thioredoxin domain-containing protein [Sphingomonas sp.]|jgi:thiol-disulfide isomerase/thioredoxin|uniref:thioredoxin domain-containing protein n=1 Tax=Sphingomonas sp. TaxID=28214 RepID=UPI00356A2E8C